MFPPDLDNNEIHIVRRFLTQAKDGVMDGIDPGNVDACDPLILQTNYITTSDWTVKIDRADLFLDLSQLGNRHRQAYLPASKALEETRPDMSRLLPTGSNNRPVNKWLADQIARNSHWQDRGPFMNVDDVRLEAESYEFSPYLSFLKPHISRLMTRGPFNELMEATGVSATELGSRLGNWQAEIALDSIEQIRSSSVSPADKFPYTDIRLEQAEPTALPGILFGLGKFVSELPGYIPDNTGYPTGTLRNQINIFLKRVGELVESNPENFRKVFERHGSDIDALTEATERCLRLYEANPQLVVRRIQPQQRQSALRSSVPHLNDLREEINSAGGRGGSVKSFKFRAQGGYILRGE